jgi:hypothetical protein
MSGYLTQFDSHAPKFSACALPLSSNNTLPEDTSDGVEEMSDINTQRQKVEEWFQS